jgi:hypothetical protein
MDPRHTGSGNRCSGGVRASIPCWLTSHVTFTRSRSGVKVSVPFHRSIVNTTFELHFLYKRTIFFCDCCLPLSSDEMSSDTVTQDGGDDDEPYRWYSSHDSGQRVKLICTCIILPALYTPFNKIPPGTPLVCKAINLYLISQTYAEIEENCLPSV